MAITSVGYAGSVDYEDWAQLSAHMGSKYTVYGVGSFKVSSAPGDRALSVAAGDAAGCGILDTSDAAVPLVGAPVSSGNRWDLVALRRDWTANTSTLVIITGTSTKALPAREIGPGVLDDQPIALVRFSSAQTAVQEIVDLRVWHGPGGAFANDMLVRDYIGDYIGASLRVGSSRWERIIAAGSVKWEEFTAATLATYTAFSTSVNATLNSLSSSLNTLKTTVQGLQTSVNRLLSDTADTGWKTSGILSSRSGWSVSGGARKVGSVIELRLTAERTGGTITAQSDGGFSSGDIDVALLVSAWRPSGFSPMINARVGGRGAGSADVRTDGSVVLSAYIPGGSILKGDNLYIRGTFLAP